METRELFRVAFRAARVAARVEDFFGQPTPLAAALDATFEHMDAPRRFDLCLAAERAVLMSRRLRLQRRGWAGNAPPKLP